MTSQTDRTVLLLWVAAAAALGSLLATLALVAQHRFSAPFVADVFVLGSTVFCVLAVATLLPEPRVPANAEPGRRAPKSSSGPVSGSSTAVGSRPSSSWSRARPGEPVARVGGPPTPTAPAAGTVTVPTPAAATSPTPIAATSQTSAAGTSQTPAAGTSQTPALRTNPTPAAGTSQTTVAGSAADIDEISLVPRADARTTASDGRQVVQCPRCGTFDVTAQQQRQGCAFQCQRCRHPWHWRPGLPWPVTVLRPRLAISERPPEPEPPVWRLGD